MTLATTRDCRVSRKKLLNLPPSPFQRRHTKRHGTWKPPLHSIAHTDSSWPSAQYTRAPAKGLRHPCWCSRTLQFRDPAMLIAGRINAMGGLCYDAVCYEDALLRTTIPAALPSHVRNNCSARGSFASLETLLGTCSAFFEPSCVVGQHGRRCRVLIRSSHRCFSFAGAGDNADMMRPRTRVPCVTAS